MHWTWLVTFASIVGTIANIKQRRWCFHVWLVTNLIWMVYDLAIGATAQAALMGVYALLAVWGLREWRPKRNLL